MSNSGRSERRTWRAAGAGRVIVAPCITWRYAIHWRMIKSFRHKGLKAFFEDGSTAGIQAQHAPRLGRMLRVLDAAAQPQDMNQAGWRLHPLKGRDLGGHFSVWVSGNWRLTFIFHGTDVERVDYQD